MLRSFGDSGHDKRCRIFLTKSMGNNAANDYLLSSVKEKLESAMLSPLVGWESMCDLPEHVLVIKGNDLKYTLRNDVCGVPAFTIYSSPVTNGDWCGQQLGWAEDQAYSEDDQAACMDVYIQQDDFAMPCKYAPTTDTPWDGSYECRGGSDTETYIMC